MQNEVSVDWLSFTVKCTQKEELSVFNIQKVQHDLMLNIDMLPALKNGKYSYSTAVEYSGYLTILFNDISAREFESTDPGLNRYLNMGIHFEMSGTGCRKLAERLSERGMSIRDYLLFLSDYGVKFSRIDIAYDDYNEMLDFEVLEEKMKQGLVVTKMRSSKHLEGYTKIESLGNEGNQKGVSLYFGNRSSMAFIRFYDKRVEQLAKKKTVDENIKSWKRYEVVLKKEKAEDFVENYKTCEDLGRLYKKIIGGLVRFIDDTDSNKSRCETSKFWKDFLDDETPIKLASKQADSDFLSVLEWFDKSVLNSLIVLLVVAESEGIDFIGELLNSKRQLNTKQQNMINEFLLSSDDYKQNIIEKIKDILK